MKEHFSVERVPSVDRQQEQARSGLSKALQGQLEKAGILLKTKRGKGDLIDLHLPKEIPKSPAHEHTHVPVTFDGFDELGLSVEDLRKEFKLITDQLLSSVRVSYRDETHTVRLSNGREVKVVAEMLREAKLHVRFSILTPSKEEAVLLMKRGLISLAWEKSRMTPEEVSLILFSRRKTRMEWLEQAVASLLTTGIELKEAIQKATQIVDDVISAQKSL